MHFRRAILAGAAAASLAAPANAGHFKGWYIGLEGGVNWVDDEEARGLVINTAVPSDASTYLATLHFDPGWAIMATVGYAFHGNWRMEGEFGYRHNDVTGTSVNSSFIFAGDLKEYSLMANIIYDVALGDKISLSLGAGAGADHAQLEGATITDTISDGEWNFAVQGIAGLNYALSRRLDLTLNYRYLHVFDPQLTDIDQASTFTIIETLTLDRFSKHTVTLGLRYDLRPDEAPKAPPPAPPPPPPPPPTVKQFIIFFGFDKCSITEEADRVLGEAASTAKSTGAASIKIVGHTDTSGSNAYNQRLSDCRAGAAKSNLVAKGILEDTIATTGRGETELMVQTGDGVKEPQNRRATVDLK